MRKYFYYQRDHKNAPLVTVCLIKWRLIVCRGIAICSPQDNPEKQEGRKRAEDRALSAYKCRKTTEEILRDEAKDVLCKTGMGTGYTLHKSVFKARLIGYEKQLLAKV